MKRKGSVKQQLLTRLSTGFLRSPLTNIKGAIFINGDKDVGQGARAALACPIQLDQLQAWRGLGWETVELEGEIHGLWPWRSWAVLGCSESKDREF